MIPILPRALTLWARTAARRWRVVPWESFEAMLPTNDAYVRVVTAVDTEVRTETSEPVARTVMITNYGAGRVDVYVNGELWGGLERSNEVNGRLVVSGHEVASIGVRKTSGPDTVVRIVFLRRI